MGNVHVAVELPRPPSSDVGIAPKPEKAAAERKMQEEAERLRRARLDGVIRRGEWADLARKT